MTHGRLTVARRMSCEMTETATSAFSFFMRMASRFFFCCAILRAWRAVLGTAEPFPLQWDQVFSLLGKEGSRANPFASSPPSLSSFFSSFSLTLSQCKEKEEEKR